MALEESEILNSSDEWLLQMYSRTGRTEYFGELYGRYISRLYGLCLKYLRRTDAAEDAVMGLFEILLPKICSYNIKVFRTWIYAVAKNHCLQLLRKEKPGLTVSLIPEIVESDPVLHLLDEPDPRRTDEALSDCLDRLPEPQRVAVTMFFLEELSYADVSEKSGYPLGAVKSYIQNGKRNLKICLEKKKEL